MPGGIIDRDDNLGIRTGRIGVRNIPEVCRKRHLQALLFAQPRLGFAARGLLQQAGGQLPRHHIERGKTVDTHGLTPVALAKEVCISLEGCMPSNSL